MSPDDARMSSRTRVAVATLIGSTIEWYDFFIYATAASLVFGPLFFEPAGGQIGTLLSFATIGVSFLFRPLGAFLAGHFGDRIGRKTMLVLTLLGMGAATTLVGVLPTYAAIGIAAPVLLCLLRIIQGISAGGEWGGSALMAVEHAPRDRRGLMGSFPQLGVPTGLILAAGFMTLCSTVIAPGEAFVQWGWRIPFLSSIALVFVGYWVRRRVSESPVFTEMAQKHERSQAPITDLLRRHKGLVILAALVFVGNNAAGYLTTGGFVTNYVTNPDGPIHFDRGAVLTAVTLSGFVYLAATLLGGYLADRLGRRRTTIIGFVAQLLLTVPFFFMIGSGSFAWLAVGVAAWYLVNGLTYGPQAAWYTELFPAQIRYTGASLAYALGAILGGAFAPLISVALVQQFGSLWTVAVYMGVITVIALVASLLLRDRPGIDLGPDNEVQQATGATVFSRPLPEPVR